MAVITISRGTFSGGQALAERVAARLGYECISREEFLESATWYGISATTLADAQETRSAPWQAMYAERTAYLMSLRAALAAKAIEGNLVYHGFAGHLLLPRISHVIRVRATADMDFRVKAVMAQQNVTPQMATEYVERVDRERSEWARAIYGADLDDPSHYDLVMNLSHISVEGASEVLAKMANLDEFKPTYQSMKAMADLGLGSRVRASLARDPRTRDADLRVVASEGALTIVGPDASPQAVVDSALAVARQVDGVRDIRWWEPAQGTPEA